MNKKTNPTPRNMGSVLGGGRNLSAQPEPLLSKLVGWSVLIITGWLRKGQESRQRSTVPFPFR